MDKIALEQTINNLKAIKLYHERAAKDAARQLQKLEGSGIPSSSRKGKEKSIVGQMAAFNHMKKIIKRMDLALNKQKEG